MKNKYRVITDSYNGFEAQVKYWYFPFMWFEIRKDFGICNSSFSVERAEKVIEWHKNLNKVVK